MPAIQSAYNANMPTALEGMVGDMSPSKVDTRGAAYRGAILAGAAFVGVSVRDITLVKLASQTADLYSQYDNMSVLVEGDIWVVPTVTITLGAVANYDVTTGQFNTAGTAIPGSRWMTAATGGNLALLRITRVP
jgi:hypothetical protein